MKRAVAAIAAGMMISVSAAGFGAGTENNPVERVLQTNGSELSDLQDSLKIMEDELITAVPEFARETPVKDLKITEESIQMGVGKSVTVTAELIPADASVQTVTWISEDPSVASVSGEGVTATVYGEDWGRTIITARSDDGFYTDSFEAIVGDFNKALKLDYISMSKSGEEIRIHVTNKSNMIIKSFTYRIVALDEHGQRADVTTNGAKYFTGDYIYRLLPGGETRHTMFRFNNYKHGGNKKVKHLTMWLTGYTLADGTVFTYDVQNRPKAVWNKK